MAGQHRAGGKITRSHTTLIDAAVPIVELCEGLAEVSKISLGEIKSIGKGLVGIKFYPINGGLRLAIRGNTSMQLIYVYTSEPDKTKWAIMKASH